MKLTEILTPLLVVAVALIDADGRILMQQRHFAAVHGGLWEFPGGKVEPGETPEDAAVREMDEELGVRIAAADLDPVGFASGFTADASEGGLGPCKPLVILLYAARNWHGIPQLRDAQAIGWQAPRAISELAMPPLDYPLADALCRYLESHSSADSTI